MSTRDTFLEPTCRCHKDEKGVWDICARHWPMLLEMLEGSEVNGQVMYEA